jgi:hypothetical protein
LTFDPQTALAYARALSFPRRVGSPGEARARAFLVERFSSFGCAVEEQPFECSTGGELAVALLLAAAQVLIILTFWAWGGWPGLAVVPALLLLGLLSQVSRLSRLAAAAGLQPQAGESAAPPASALERALRWVGRLGRAARTANVVARHWPPEPANAPELILVAHWDSKSQPLPLVARMALVSVAGLSAVVFAVLTLLRLVWPAATSAAALAGLAALLAGVPLLLLYLSGSGNASPGALDNASGAGLVLHLAETFCSAPPPCKLTFLITGAEELGVLGASAYVRAAQAGGAWAQPSAVHVLNLDGVGSDGPLAYVGPPDTPLAHAVRVACAHLGLPLRRLPPIGALFDHIPFALAGLDALSLVTTGAAARAVHTPADTADRLSPLGFSTTGSVVQHVVTALAPSSPPPAEA